MQKAELTRLSQTFLHVPQLHWIVVEDSPHKTPLVTDFLMKSGLTYTHLHVPTAKDRKLQEVGGGDGSKRPTSLLSWWGLCGADVSALSLPSSGGPQLAEASRGGAEERGPAVAERRQEASAWGGQAARGGLLR